MPCSCERKLIGSGMTEVVGAHSSSFELRKLGSCVFYHGTKRGYLTLCLSSHSFIHSYFHTLFPPGGDDYKHQITDMF